MKCNKCGFTSFDFLSECMNCGLDLTATRDALGLLTMKPSIPFFLGELLKSYDQTPAKATSESAAADVQESSVGIEFGDDFELGEGLIIGEEDEHPSVAQDGREVAVARREPSDDLTETFDESLLIELSDEDLSQFIRDTESDESLNLELDFQLEAESTVDLDSAASNADAPTQVMRPEPSGGHGAEPLDETPTIDLSDEDLDKFMLDEDLEMGFDFQIEDSAGIGHDTANVAGTADVKKSGIEATESTLVVDLSEDDLEDFLLELEETQVDKGKTAGKGEKTSGASQSK